MLMVDGVEMVDVKEAAQLTRRTPETIRRWVWSGRLDHLKRGNRLLVSRAEVTALTQPAARTDDVRRPSLATWASTAKARRSGTRGTSAADLVWDDRAGR
ncbi:MAG: helix-turn-helix domain-containing protein [Nocardioides sp.]